MRKKAQTNASWHFRAFWHSHLAHPQNSSCILQSHYSSPIFFFSSPPHPHLPLFHTGKRGLVTPISKWVHRTNEQAKGSDTLTRGLLAACASGPIRTLITVDTKPPQALWSQLRQILLLRLSDSRKKKVGGGRRKDHTGKKNKKMHQHIFSEKISSR